MKLLDKMKMKRDEEEEVKGYRMFHLHSMCLFHCLGYTNTFLSRIFPLNYKLSFLYEGIKQDNGIGKKQGQKRDEIEDNNKK